MTALWQEKVYLRSVFARWGFGGTGGGVLWTTAIKESDMARIGVLRLGLDEDDDEELSVRLISSGSFVMVSVAASSFRRTTHHEPDDCFCTFTGTVAFVLISPTPMMSLDVARTLT